MSLSDGDEPEGNEDDLVVMTALFTARLLSLGPDASAFVAEIVLRHPRTWPSEVERLHAMLNRYGPDALLRAMREAGREGDVTDRDVYDVDPPTLRVRSSSSKTASSTKDEA